MWIFLAEDIGGIEKEEDVEDCNVEKCCELSEWSEWTSCSVTCGEGIETRTRSYDEE